MKAILDKQTFERLSILNELENLTREIERTCTPFSLVKYHQDYKNENKSYKIFGEFLYRGDKLIHKSLHAVNKKWSIPKSYIRFEMAELKNFIKRFSLRAKDQEWRNLYDRLNCMWHECNSKINLIYPSEVAGDQSDVSLLSDQMKHLKEVINKIKPIKKNMIKVAGRHGSLFSRIHEMKEDKGKISLEVKFIEQDVVIHCEFFSIRLLQEKLDDFYYSKFEEELPDLYINFEQNRLVETYFKCDMSDDDFIKLCRVLDLEVERLTITTFGC